MKKFIISFCIMIFSISIFAQQYVSVSVYDEVYSVLNAAEIRGLCSPLNSQKPYTRDYISKKLDEILSSLNNLDETDSYSAGMEIEAIRNFIERFETAPEGVSLKNGTFRASNESDGFPVSIEFNDTFTGFVSAGLYNADDDIKRAGYDLFNFFNLTGDIGNNLSWYTTGFIGFTRMPLDFTGSYNVGYWWYEGENNEYRIAPPFDGNDVNLRKINTYKNYAVLPYSYKRIWDGSVFYLKNFNAAGLEGWPFYSSLGYGMKGEIRAAFLNDIIEIGAGRVEREWAAMDNGASLVLNSHGRPFFGVDFFARPFKAISLSALTGVLEFPNQSYIVSEGDANAWPKRDSMYFQNAFSIAQFDLDLMNFHFDFGSSCIWPKRFEIGYMFPLIDRVVYQDNIGDYDNLALFTDLKYTYPEIGSVWLSFFLDEMPRPNLKNMFNLDRYMFAFQAGTKAVIPFLPFGTLSFRYTKIEPYCYTHQAINYTPWYDGYISESYTNNGECLGYYLPPNSDEFHIRMEAKPLGRLRTALQYQLVRHGADYGTRQVDGSSLYSELTPGEKARKGMKKYFLHDGAYEWSNIISLSGSYDFRQFDFPVTIDFSAGYIYSFFTDTNTALGVKGDYKKVDAPEYPVSNGFVLSIGFTLFGL